MADPRVTDNGERLAEVIYFPGVTPPPPAAAPPESDQTRHDEPAWATPGVTTDSVNDPPTAPASHDRAQRRAENISMRALTRRGLSRWELEQQLTRRELDPDGIQAELDRLESAGLIDDAALAVHLVRTARERKGLGRAALVAELRRRHVDNEHIDAALADIDLNDEQRQADDLAARRAPQLRSLDRVTAVRRLSGYLQRKGYSGDIVRIAVDTALAPQRPSGGPRFE